jgi:hypothetical protein
VWQCVFENLFSPTIPSSFHVRYVPSRGLVRRERPNKSLVEVQRGVKLFGFWPNHDTRAKKSVFERGSFEVQCEATRLTEKPTKQTILLVIQLCPTYNTLHQTF